MTAQTSKFIRPEIMAPAGSFESLMAAIQGGADSVYFGAGRLNMRSASSVNFSPADLEEISSRCAEHGLRSYLTLNTILYDSELQEAEEMIRLAVRCGISAIIASDPWVITRAHGEGMEVHISTQCNISNREAVRFYARYADVMVAARELSLEQVGDLYRFIQQENICGPSGKPVRLELFAHGALCMAVSGKCYLSLDNYNRSANRGACVQPCRRKYLLTDREDAYAIEVDHEYLMSPKDLCTIGFLDRLVGAGASVLKIEGRGRSPEYVKTVTACYAEAAAALAEGTYSPGKAEAWTERLKMVYNRGFWEGYYLGKHTGEWAGIHGSAAGRKKEYIGMVANYYSKIGVAEIRMDSGRLSCGDDVVINGPTTGVCETRVAELHDDFGRVESATKGSLCSFAVPAVVRRGDKVYRWVEA